VATSQTTTIPVRMRLTIYPRRAIIRLPR
jgi:hypothetical protein